MVCNCQHSQNENNVIQIIAGTSVNLTFLFDGNISSYTDGVFAIRKNYETEPVIYKTVPVTEESVLNMVLTPEETAGFMEFENGKNQASYIWGLDLTDSARNIITNIFPQVGNPAPICVVYKHVVTEE